MGDDEFFDESKNPLKLSEIINMSICMKVLIINFNYFFIKVVILIIYCFLYYSMWDSRYIGAIVLC